MEQTSVKHRCERCSTADWWITTPISMQISRIITIQLLSICLIILLLLCFGFYITLLQLMHFLFLWYSRIPVFSRILLFCYAMLCYGCYVPTIDNLVTTCTHFNSRATALSMTITDNNSIFTWISFLFIYLYSLHKSSNTSNMISHKKERNWNIGAGKTTH